MYLAEKLYINAKSNVSQNEAWETDPSVEKIVTHDEMLREVLLWQQVFPKNCESLITFLASFVFRNISAKNPTLSSYSFKVLKKIILMKNRISRECFKSMDLLTFLYSKIGEILGELEVKLETMDKREGLFEALSICYLSDQLDDYIKNSHKIVQKIFDPKEFVGLSDQVILS